MEVIKAGDAQTGTDSIVDPGEIVTALLQAAGYVRHRLNEFLERFELTEGRHAVLLALDHNAKGLSQSEVAEKMMQSESNISSLIERLHREGFVDRRWSDTDRRKRVLLLTDKGQRLIQKVGAARRRWAESLLVGLTSHSRGTMLRGLKVIPVQGDIRPESASPLENTGGPVWPSHSVLTGRDPSSPQFALERMLSTLGLAGRFAEDEQ